MAVSLITVILMVAGVVSGQEMCRPHSPRSDCGYYGINEYECEGRGCCWTPTEGQPWCYYKSTAPQSYKVVAASVTAFGIKMTVEADPSASSEFGDLMTPLNVDITTESSSRLNVKIYPRNDTTRWQIPDNVSSAGEIPPDPPTDLLYDYVAAEVGQYFYFAVKRASDGEVLFNSSFISQPLEFADQFVAIATTLPGNESLYGLGERKTRLKLEKGRTYTIWNFDSPSTSDLNSYGSHPFYLDLRQSGKAHGVYMRNSNGMDVIYGDDFLTYRINGGILDMYFFLGPTPEGVIQQYQEVIGRPFLPPYWALGFHQSRYGYADIQSLRDVVGNYSENEIPLDAIWSDIDYMDEYKVFTMDPSNYPADEMKEFVTTLHNNDQQYVVVINPGIKVEENYKPYTVGMEKKVFIMDKDGREFTGKQWPGIVVYPDFFKEDVTPQYWSDQITEFYKTVVEVDGLWINMNEISNFCNGECANVTHDKQLRSVKKLGFDPVDPPYKINNQGTHAPLNTKTLDMDATHNDELIEYNVHSLYGLMSSKPTASTLQTLRNKRSLVISRSTFPGSGSYAGHTPGNNHATYEDLFYSIPEMLNFQMFGIPLVGSDICGYLGDTTEELCSRWMEVGAFYPFARNHNDKNAIPQEPYRWPSVAAISQWMLAIRYLLLPYYYTLFYKASRPVTSTPSATVTRPLFFEFPDDLNTHYIDSQFMVGDGLLISPIMEEGSTSREAYFPRGRWYSMFVGAEVVSSTEGATLTLDVPVDDIPIHIRGGSIIPGQEGAMTATASAQTNSLLLVALDDEGSASGDLYIDDGESTTPTQYLFISFAVTSQCNDGQLVSTIEEKAGDPMDLPPMDGVAVMGVEGTPTKAFYDGEAIPDLYFYFDSTNRVIHLTYMDIDVNNAFKITWE